MAERGQYYGPRVRGRGKHRSDDPDVKLSKGLSWILRHGAEKEGLTLEEGGFLYVEDILKKQQFKPYSLTDVERVVKNNNKQRFYLEQDAESGRPRIRANQGHTMNVEVDMAVITDPGLYPVVVHGTYTKNWLSIKSQGLNRMKRNHIHLAPGEPGESGVTSGMRASCDILIYIDLSLAMTDGLKFYLSANNVILTCGDERGSISPKYFKRVIERGTRKEIEVNKGR